MLKNLIYILLFVFAACNNDDITIPENIIPQSKMVQILADFHLAEVTANYKSLGDTNRIDVMELYSQIYKKHSITKEQYKESYQFYLEHPTLLNKMYDEVINELSRRQTEIQNN